MRLKYIEQADFRMSEQTNFEAWVKKNKALANQLSKDDVILFVNHGGNQLVFIHGFKTIQTMQVRGSTEKPRELKILSSRRLRMTGGRVTVRGHGDETSPKFVWTGTREQYFATWECD